LRKTRCNIQEIEKTEKRKKTSKKKVNFGQKLVLPENNKFPKK